MSLAIVEGDQVVHLDGYGAADPSGRPVTAQTPFAIGSITKAFTALAVMQLVEAGKVELDAPVQRYLPWFRVADPAASARITVRHLLTMTSGLPQLTETQLWTAQDDGVLERVVRRLATVEPSRPVGSFGYSNANFEVLGLIVQYVSGASYESYVQGHVFTPLDMRGSFLAQEEALRHGMASGHQWWFGFPVAVTYPFNRAELPAGYIFSSAEDMAHFLVAQLNGGRFRGTSVLSPAGIASTHEPPAGGTYGMGWELTPLDGRLLIGHDGGTANFQASVFLDTEARMGVFVAANAMNGLDAFSSPPGNTPVDGPTVRAVAQTVLSIATGQPWPPQGPGHRRLTLAFDAVIVVLSAAFALLLRRIPRWLRLLLPVVLAFLMWKVPAWKAFVVRFQPDLSAWLVALAVVSFASALLETVRARRA
jgi:CubicO group peptidase (beta-lactamase class C family)